MKRHLTVLLVVLTVLSAAVGCSSSDEGGDESATTTQIEEPATTVAAPETVTTAASTTTTTTTTTAASPVVLDVTFTGEACLVEGSTKFPAGPVEIVFVNDSEELAAPGLALFTGDETFQDYVEYMGPEPAGRYEYGPEWTEPMGTSLPIGGGKTRTWEGTLQSGRYYLICDITKGQMAGFTWYGAGLTVE